MHPSWIDLGGMAMPYKVVVGGIEIMCDSAEEALAIAQRASGDEPPHRIGAGHERGATSGRWTESRLADFLRFVKPEQRKVIDALLEHHDGRTDEQLCQLLGYADGRQLAGTLSALWKNAKKAGADPKDLIVKRPVTIGDKRIHEYTLTESFKHQAGKAKK
jgi:hypothetical protein